MFNNQIQNFWLLKADLLSWRKKPTYSVKKKGNNYYDWYGDGLINASFNCLDKNIQEGKGNKPALIFVSNEMKILKLSYNKLLNSVEKFCQIITDIYKFNPSKINNKDFYVMIHGSASLETSIAMLACARLGLSHSVVFEDLENEAIKKRIKLLKPKIFISRSDNSKLNKLLKLFTQKNKKIKIISFSNYKINLKKIYKVQTKDLINKKLKCFKSLFYYPGNKTLFSLFTSGSTGLPKGIIHSTAGFLLYAKYTCAEKFGLNKNSVMLCASDAGWINGHTYALYGPLSFGATTILIEKPTTLLNRVNLIKILTEFKVSVLYMPVTLIRMLKSLNYSKFQPNNLKTLGSMGEPLAKNVATWFAKMFINKKKSIVNTYFQTETGGIIASPSHNEKNGLQTHGTVGKAVNKFIKIKFLKNNSSLLKKEILLSSIWPGCMKGILNEKKIWNNYWDKNGNFKLFDLGSYDKNKNLLIHGRTDDVINIRGHRIGSGEIESNILKIDYISEACAIALPDKLEGHCLVLFVVSKKTTEKNKDEIKKIIFKNFGSFALPKEVYFVKELPKTRSGKIMRRLLRDLFEKKTSKKSDLSTILKINVIKDIKKKLNYHN